MNALWMDKPLIYKNKILSTNIEILNNNKKIAIKIKPTKSITWGLEFI